MKLIEMKSNENMKHTHRTDGEKQVKIGMSRLLLDGKIDHWPTTQTSNKDTHTRARARIWSHSHPPPPTQRERERERERESLLHILFVRAFIYLSVSPYLLAYDHVFQSVCHVHISDRGHVFVFPCVSCVSLLYVHLNTLFRCVPKLTVKVFSCACFF